MTDQQKGLVVNLLTNDGQELPEHQRHVVNSAMRGTLGQGTKLLLDEIFRETIRKEAEKLNREE
jgi:hypothetical protein